MEYCISDIHGEYLLLNKLLEYIKFSSGDVLYVLGDMIDKGKQSLHVVKMLMKMPNVICILGNHENDFLKYYHSLMRDTEDYNGVLEKLRGYFGDEGIMLEWEMLDWLETLPYYIETEKFIGVHSGVPLVSGKPMMSDSVDKELLLYDRHFKDTDVIPDTSKCIIFGHTPVRSVSGEDRILFYEKNKQCFVNNAIDKYCKIHIDMGTYWSGVLGCLCVDDCSTYYVKRKINV